MKLIRAEQQLDRADGRVDFRDLATEFHRRIEMRQIGARDEAKLLGGYGSCGRPLCCTTWLRGFEPISIKMAKRQNLSLSPSRLSGLCGRLKCCLRYELPNAAGEQFAGCAHEGSLQPHRLVRRRLRRVRAGRSFPMALPRIGITSGDPARPGGHRSGGGRAGRPRSRVLAVCEPVLYSDARRRRLPAGRGVGAGRARPLPGGHARRAGTRWRIASTPSSPARSTSRRGRWPGCAGAGTPSCWPS